MRRPGPGPYDDLDQVEHAGRHGAQPVATSPHRPDRESASVVGGMRTQGSGGPRTWFSQDHRVRLPEVLGGLTLLAVLLLLF